MNNIAIITAFLGGIKNRYIQYEPNRTLEEKFGLASQVEDLLCSTCSIRNLYYIIIA